MSQPCGFLSDLLSCTHRHIYQTLKAPPHTCPVCNGGFADCETIEMVQGPLGCNQVVPGQLVNAPLAMQAGLSGQVVSSGALGPTTVPVNALTSTLQPPAPHGTYLMTTNGSPVTNALAVSNIDSYFTSGTLEQNGWTSNHERKKSWHKSKYKHEFSDRPEKNCVVM